MALVFFPMQVISGKDRPVLFAGGLLWRSSQHNSAALPMQVISVKDYDLYCHYVAGLVGVGLSQLFASSGAGQEGNGILCACGAVRGGAGRRECHVCALAEWSSFGPRRRRLACHCQLPRVAAVAAGMLHQ